MGEAGRRKVLGRSWSAVGDELLDHYRSVIAARAVEDALLTREAAGLTRGPRFD
jgi:phosphatidylinositol alpha 1,6-mannosyltransferase